MATGCANAHAVNEAWPEAVSHRLCDCDEGIRNPLFATKSLFIKQKNAQRGKFAKKGPDLVAAAALSELLQED